MPQRMTHHKWTDFKYLHNDSKALGESMLWEWRYFHDHIGIKTKDVDDFLRYQWDGRKDSWKGKTQNTTITCEALKPWSINFLPSTS